MTSLRPTRPMTGLAAAGLGIALLAGCSAEDDGSTSAEGSPEPTSATAEAAPEEQPATPEMPVPDPDATGESEVTSLGGTLSAQIPNAWGAFPDEALQQAAEDPNTSDVLGAWMAGDGETSQYQVAVMSQPQDPEVPGADEYYDTYLSQLEEQVELTHETFESDSGDEVLLASIEADEQAGTPGESTFLVFTGEEMVVGSLTGPGAIDDTMRDEFRALAASIAVA